MRLCQNRSSGGLVPRPVSDPDAADRLPRLQEQKRHPPTVELHSGDQHFHKFRGGWWATKRNVFVKSAI